MQIIKVTLRSTSGYKSITSPRVKGMQIIKVALHYGLLKYHLYDVQGVDKVLAPRGRHPIATGSEHCASNEETLVIVSIPD